MGKPSPLVSPVLRDDLPRYPPLLQLLRVTGATVIGPSGSLGSSSAGIGVIFPYLYVASTQQLKTDSLLPRDREPCLVSDINGEGLTPGYYLGRLAGSFNSLPIYEVTVAVGPAGPAGAAGSASTFSGARVYRTADQSFDATTAVQFNNEQFDTDGYHDNTTNNTRLTVPSTAYYQIGCNIALDPGLTGSILTYEIRLNNTTNICHYQVLDTINAIVHVNLTTVWSASSGDYFEIIVDDSAANTGQIVALTSSEPIFWIHRLGT